MDDDFSVGLGPELVTAVLQLVPQSPEVIDLAAIADQHRAVFVA